jgi:rhombotail lipoprotein
MKFRNVIGFLALIGSLSGCALVEHTFCAPNCTTQTHNSSSLVSFLYPDGKTPPPTNTVPELHVPLRVGLAFLPSQSATLTPISAAQKQDLLEQIRQRFSTRKFVSEIVIIPDYYLASARGYSGLEGVQRLYNIDVMALVSYDQVTHTDDNKLSLAYFTIVGAYVLPGSSHDTATLIDLAVVDPATRSLVIRAGGTSASHGSSTLIDVERDSRTAAAKGFSEATSQMIGNFDLALTAFQEDVRNGKANVKVVSRSGGSSAGGGGSMRIVDLLMLGFLAGASCAMRRRAIPSPICD